MVFYPPMKAKTKIGVIGFGNMGQAIAQGLKAKYSLIVFDKDSNKTKKISKIKVTDDINDLIGLANTLILAVKPQDFDSVLEQLAGKVSSKLIVSIAAGISTGYIEKALGGAKVIRVMPNLPAKIGQGMSCLAKGRLATKNDLIFVKSLFKRLGETLVIKETMMNAATAVSGSGPGFFYNFLVSENINSENISKKNSTKVIKNFTPFLVKAACVVGFSLKEAKILANATILGSFNLLKKSKLEPADLRQQVASPGGTTQAGLNVLAGGRSLSDAVKAAKERAQELSKKVK